MSIFPQMNQRTKVILPIKNNLSIYNDIPEHTEILTNTQISSIEDGPTVVARYRNLTIGAGATLTTSNRCCGLVLVVDGDLNISGTISMTARGAVFAPTVNHKIKNDLFPVKDVMYEIDIPATADEIANFLKKEKKQYHSFNELPAIYRPTFYAFNPQSIYSTSILAEIPDIGGTGGILSVGNSSGVKGVDGTNRGTGGGGSGGSSNATGVAGFGGAGTCYSGGSGGGGCYNLGSKGGNGKSFGGPGGAGYCSSTSYGAGGGAGNPGGAGAAKGVAGGNGTGGLLIIICTGKITCTGSITAHGVAGGTGTGSNTGGGGSGGGSINIFYNLLENNGTISANGGAGGGGYRLGASGGAGCVTFDQYNF